MKVTLALLIFIGLFISCQSEYYGCDDLKFSNGYYYEINTGKLANGNLVCIEDRDGHNYIHETRSCYKNGRRIGDWTYLVQNHIIHYGKIVADKELEAKISKLFAAKYIELEIWYEGNFAYFDLSIIEPNLKLDSARVQEIVNTDLKRFMTKNQVKGVDIQIFRISGGWSNSFYRLNKVL